MSAEDIITSLGEVLDPAPTAALCATANREHRLAMAAAGSMLDHVIAAGEALMMIRSEVPSGSWHAWLDENFEGTRKTARQYVRLAYYRDQIGMASTTEEALERVRGLPWTSGPSTNKGSAALQRAKERAREARAALRRQEDAETVRRRGGNVARSYSHVRKALQALEHAADFEGDRDAKSAIAEAMVSLYEAEDRIVRASKRSAPRAAA